MCDVHIGNMRGPISCGHVLDSPPFLAVTFSSPPHFLFLFFPSLPHSPFLFSPDQLLNVLPSLRSRFPPLPLNRRSVSHYPLSSALCLSQEMKNLNKHTLSGSLYPSQAPCPTASPVLSALLLHPVLILTASSTDVLITGQFIHCLLHQS